MCGGEKRDKIKRTTAILDIEDGGISIPSIYEYINSLKLSWLRKLYQNTYKQKWKTLLTLRYPTINKMEIFGGKFFT